MNKKKFEKNVEYLERCGCYVSGDVFENTPFSAEVFSTTPSCGEFSVKVEELSREELTKRLINYDVEEVAQSWMESEQAPFENVADLIDDMNEGKNNLFEIANDMPF